MAWNFYHVPALTAGNKGVNIMNARLSQGSTSNQVPELQSPQGQRRNCHRSPPHMGLPMGDYGSALQGLILWPSGMGPG